MKKPLFTMTGLLFIAFVAFASLFQPNDPIFTVSQVNLDQYKGTWYAISSLPRSFTKNCSAQVAEYKKLNKEKLSVTNICFKKDGTEKSIEGAAKTTQTPGKLKIKFDTWWAKLFNIKSDYNIIRLSKGYKYAMVGSKDRKSLWILSKERSMPENIYKSYLEFAKKLGFPVTKLKKSQFPKDMEI